ncbi:MULTISPECIES: hypothetical protein [unclassified Streptomyces]|uniref:hypothetical protein n=1 Tax=unclassified Streptomyces TaxID=2593676 RepID=UPI000DC7D343|nr:MULTISPECIES: hypothetical protein [unclassified Streptomyces]AWZ05615.1 hypothetical protein DRB89_14165 [Streptomyces sp. ICC4]AWZ12559.1 hypothetical protein DRB96_09760 [Streptomyces sp. ICC1]
MTVHTTPAPTVPDSVSAPPASTDPALATVPGVSRAARWAAKGAALTLLPTGLWRTAIAFGIPSGFKEGDVLHVSNYPSRYSFYLIALSVVAELIGLLALGLVQRWGEVMPHWVPWLGGRRIPPLAAVIPAATGAALVTLITVYCAFGWSDPENMGGEFAPTGIARWVMTASYAPLLLWGPLLAFATAAYWRRRRIHG